MTGDRTGDMTGDRTGDQWPDRWPDRWHDRWPDRTGDMTGDMTGPVTGPVINDRTGDMTGDRTGDQWPDRTGDMSGDRTGRSDVDQWSVINVPGDVPVISWPVLSPDNDRMADAKWSGIGRCPWPMPSGKDRLTGVAIWSDVDRLSKRLSIVRSRSCPIPGDWYCNYHLWSAKSPGIYPLLFLRPSCSRIYEKQEQSIFNHKLVTDQIIIRHIKSLFDHNENYNNTAVDHKLNKSLIQNRWKIKWRSIRLSYGTLKSLLHTMANDKQSVNRRTRFARSRNTLEEHALHVLAMY